LTIVDLGSHIGASIVFFRDRYPDALIIGVEPDPDSFAKLRENTKLLPRLELHNCAVADRAGEAPFYQSSWSWESTLVARDGGPSSTRVPVRTLDEIVGNRTVDLLKVDIEGAEYAALRAFGGLHSVRALAVEYHADTCPASFAEFLGLLEGFSIERISGDSAHRSVILALAQR
jgi:FkbM family methyltransferase